MLVFKDKFITELEHSEKYFQDFLINNWDKIFPFLTFIKKEYPLYDNSVDNKIIHRIDILAFNRNLNKYTLIELKKTKKEKYALPQIIQYYENFKNNFWSITYQIKEKYNNIIPDNFNIEDASIIIFSKSFSESTVNNLKYNKLDPILLTYRLYKEENEDIIFTFKPIKNNEVIKKLFQNVEQKEVKSIETFDKTIKNVKPKKIKENTKKTNDKIEIVLKPSILNFIHIDKNLKPPKKIKNYVPVFRGAHMSHIRYYLSEVEYNDDLPRLSKKETYFNKKFNFAIHRNSSNSFYLYLDKDNYSKILEKI